MALTCASDPLFRDSLGYTCIAYDSYNWCKNGTYGSGWSLSRPAHLFIDFKNSHGIDASQSCCSCKNGCSSCVPEVCHDDDSWFDSNDDGCATYEQEKYCDNTGVPGKTGLMTESWVSNHPKSPDPKEGYNDFHVYASYFNFDATQKCCACSDKKDVSCIRDNSTTQFGSSIEDKCCIDDPHWVDSEGRGCHTYSYERLCQNGAYGTGWVTKLRFTDFADNHGIDATSKCCGCMSQYAEASPPCIDDDGWIDSRGEGCAIYKNLQYCDGFGNYGKYWKPGSHFSDRKSYGYDASEKCCECNRKQETMCHDDNTYVATSVQSLVEEFNKKTTAGTCCLNNDQWRDSFNHTCDNYLELRFCDKGRYGIGWSIYHDNSSFADIAISGETDATYHCCQCNRYHATDQTENVCVDDDAWRDSIGRGCIHYETEHLCDGEYYGVGWNTRMMGNFENFRDDKGHDASQKCCQCSLSKSTTCDLYEIRDNDTTSHGLYRPDDSGACCRDDQHWNDSKGRNCDFYVRQNFCFNGGPGSGWRALYNDEPFSNFDSLDTFLDASEACCQCAPSACVTDTVWKDRGNYTCKNYTEKQWCSGGKSYGSGWNPLWGTFDDFISSNGVKSFGAKSKCCECSSTEIDPYTSSMKSAQYAVSIVVYAGVALYCLHLRFNLHRFIVILNNPKGAVTPQTHSALTPLTFLGCFAFLSLRALHCLSEAWRTAPPSKGDPRSWETSFKSFPVISSMITRLLFFPVLTGMWFMCFIQFHETSKTATGGGTLRLLAIVITILFFVFGVAATIVSVSSSQLSDLESALGYIYPLFWACIIIAVSVEMVIVHKAITLLSKARTSRTIQPATTAKKPSNSDKLAQRLLIYCIFNTVSGACFCLSFVFLNKLGESFLRNCFFDVSCVALAVGFLYLVWPSYTSLRHKAKISSSNSGTGTGTKPGTRTHPAKGTRPDGKNTKKDAALDGLDSTALGASVVPHGYRGTSLGAGSLLVKEEVKSEAFRPPARSASDKGL